MRVCREFSQIIELIYLYKVFFDHGKENFVKYIGSDIIHEDDYYDVVFNAIYDAADIVSNNEKVYARHGYCGDDDVNIFSFSNKEMRDYFKIARKLHRIKGGGRYNPYIRTVHDKAEELLNFNSYCFDWLFVNKRKSASLDVLWSYEFNLEVWMTIWIVRVMDMFKEELENIRVEYRKARREKRCRPKGGRNNAPRG